MTSTTPPSESPSFAAALISAIMAAALVRVEASNLALVDDAQVARQRARSRCDRTVPICTTWLSTSMPIVARRDFARCPADHARRRLTRAGSLEDVASVIESVLLHARQVGVTGSRRGQFLRRRARRRPTSLAPTWATRSLRSRRATGDPSVRPCRTPPRGVIRLARTACADRDQSPVDDGRVLRRGPRRESSPAGRPSTMTLSEGP